MVNYKFKDVMKNYYPVMLFRRRIKTGVNKNYSYGRARTYILVRKILVHINKGKRVDQIRSEEHTSELQSLV